MPSHREGRVSLWRYVRLFRRDILSAQPAHLYHALMAEFKTPFFSSYLINDPALVDHVLREEGDAFPKSERQSAGLRALLGQSVFVTNGAQWRAQRRIIDPAFEVARLAMIVPHIEAATTAMVTRIGAQDGPVNIEPVCSYAAADVIFRTLFSVPIEDEMAQSVYQAFQRYQSAQPLLNTGAFVGRRAWGLGRAARRSAREIRKIIGQMVERRARQIADGDAPDDLATRIMTTADPETGQRFSKNEMLDQVAIFFLAGHETSAAALGWALYLATLDPEWQDQLAQDAQHLEAGRPPKALQITAHFKETLRLYPPVPMMVRTVQAPQIFRKRSVNVGAQIVISPWHLHRHDRIWKDPHHFDPKRFLTPETKEAQRKAYVLFSKGPRVCPGAHFAMTEGVVMLAGVLKAYRVTAVGDPPIPMAHLTVRSRDGIYLTFEPR